MSSPRRCEHGRRGRAARIRAASRTRRSAARSPVRSRRRPSSATGRATLVGRTRLGGPGPTGDRRASSSTATDGGAGDSVVASTVCMGQASSRSWSVTVRASADTAGESMRRGRSMSTENSAVTRPGRRRHHDDPVGESGRFADVVGDEQHGQSSRSHAVRRARRAGRRGSSRRARRTVRPSAGCRRPGRSARASATRWRIPPDSSCGRLSANPSRCTVAEQLRGAAARSALRDAGEPHGELDVLGDGEPREQRRLLEHHAPACPSTSTVPALGASSPATRLRIVDLPHPEAPTRQTNSPRSMCRSTDCRARSPRRSPVPKVLSTPPSRTMLTAPPPPAVHARRAPR